MPVPRRRFPSSRAARLGIAAFGAAWLITAPGIAAPSAGTGPPPAPTPSPTESLPAARLPVDPPHLQPPPRAEAAPTARPTPVVPTYTNADLDRLRPLRHQVGGGAVAAASPERPSPAEEDDSRERAERERYWRREADRHRERVLRLQERLEALRERLERERSRPPRQGQAAARERTAEALGARIERVSAQLRELEWRFEERARREGALPGWLR